MTEPHRELIGRLFPELGEVESLDRIEGGWTCDTYEVNRGWIVQVPRTPYVEDRIRAQIAILPELHREVSAQIPLPELTSSEPAMAYRKLDGSPPADDVGIWPERLGWFLYDLHLVPPEFVGLRAVSPELVRERTRQVWGSLRSAGAPLLDEIELRHADAVVDGYLNDDRNWGFAPCLTHGDLVLAHVLVSGSGDLVGVIDWEEVSVSDPAIDFAWWLDARPETGERILAAYGGAPDERFRERARASFALMPWHDLRHAVEEADAASVEAGLARVREQLAMTGA